MNSIVRQRVFSDRFTLVFNFDFQFRIDVQYFFREFNYIDQFLWCQAVIEIIGFPKLKIDNFFLAYFSSAINKVACDDSDFCNVKMFRYESSIWQLENHCI